MTGRKKSALTVVALFLLGVGLALLRTHLLDSAASALKQENGTAAITRLEPLAWVGDATAQALLGCAYAYGWAGVKKNDARAVYWFRRAAWFAGDETESAAAAELSVAKSYAFGTNGVKPDPIESSKWLGLAAAGGSKEAARMLADSHK